MMTSRLKLLLVLLAIAATASGALAYLGGDVRETGGHRTARVQRGPIIDTIAATGTVSAVALVQVSSQLSGQIRELHVDYNSRVKRGDLLALIAPESFAARVEEATAEVATAQVGVASGLALRERARRDLDVSREQLRVLQAQTQATRATAELARREVERKRSLGRSDAVSAVDRDRAESEHQRALATLAAAEAHERVHQATIAAGEASLQVAEVEVKSAQAIVAQREAAVRQAQVDFDRTRITAPIDGVVIERNIDVGQTVAASLQAPTLFTIAQDLAKLQIEAYVDETDIGRVREGQIASFTVGAYPGATFDGRVAQVRLAPQLIQNVVTYIVVIAVDNADGRLLPGMTATLKIAATSVEDALLVPNAALRFRLAGEEEARARRSEAVRAAVRAGRHSELESGDSEAGERGMVYRLDFAGILHPVPLQLGISDGRFTQVLSGDLKSGDELAIGYVRQSFENRRNVVLPRL
ncbi:MAG TPA: efflux RND transporter periplasmic adaptor subunit [Alphaproteobacteria bacterium]|nr:efflux RND transporter periplasmic adaptor subunit [Alphaproteobacteria bacterium]